MTSEFDIIFLSYSESNAETNWQSLIARYPRAQRVHGVHGVVAAHLIAAQLSRTDFFFIVDGDNQLQSDFKLQVTFPTDLSTVYVWRALNPVNDLCYGYGGIKLYNKSLFEKFLTKPQQTLDLATTIAPDYKPIPIVGSTTHFNSTPLEAWRGAFRETVKLTHLTLRSPNDGISLQRLNTWCQQGHDRKNGAWAIKGALQGRSFAEKQWQKEGSQPHSLSQINNFQFLNSLFDCHDTESFI